eukprot:gnl/Trimastix_PCT/3749.p1 GENE.gnl/Trimastix_PCT/3749~~gnl/Trimastix_PCT/3749.p1  ORF type:complete len:467 (+),score=134.29 gnl/Trimastix_PCT/3749:52-1452(+)
MEQNEPQAAPTMQAMGDSHPSPTPEMILPTLAPTPCNASFPAPEAVVPAPIAAQEAAPATPAPTSTSENEPVDLSDEPAPPTEEVEQPETTSSRNVTPSPTVDEQSQVSVVESTQSTTPALLACEWCQENTAEYECADCCKILCSGCNEFLHMKGPGQKHRVTKVGHMIYPRNCADHPTERVSLYCTDDQTLVCYQCVLAGTHRNHHCTTFAEAGEELTRSLDALQAQVAERRGALEANLATLYALREEALKRASSEADAIRTQFTELVTLTNARQAEVLGELEQTHQERLGALDGQILKLSHHISVLNTAASGQTLARHDAANLDFLHEAARLKRAVSETESKAPFAPAIELGAPREVDTAATKAMIQTLSTEPERAPVPMTTRSKAAGTRRRREPASETERKRARESLCEEDIANVAGIKQTKEGLCMLVHMKDGSRKFVTTTKLSAVCPKKIIEFYESKLVFS